MKEWVGLAARLVVGGVFFWAGWIKLFEPHESAGAVRAYQLLPGDVADQVGYLLPALEVIVAIALVLGLLTRGAAVLAALMLVAFIVGIVSVWVRGIEIDCGCFGGGGAKAGASSSYPWEIARDLGLLVACGYTIWLGATRLTLDHLLFRHTAGTPVTDIEEGEA